MEITVQLSPKPEAQVGFTVTFLAGEGDMAIISGDLPEIEVSLEALRQEARRLGVADAEFALEEGGRGDLRGERRPDGLLEHGVRLVVLGV
jgi:hypothetical protein